MGKDKTLPQASNGWQVIVVQARGGHRPNTPPAPLQATILYGDQKESTPLVEERQPLWNFWVQMPDRGGNEKMLFSLIERDKATGKTSVRGEVRLDLTKYRSCGKSFDMWAALTPKAGEGDLGEAATTVSELHLTVMYNSFSDDVYLRKDTGVGGTGCLLCIYGSSADCTIS